MMFKHFTILMITALYAVSAVMGQTDKSGQEMSIEESYLQEALELMIINETSRSSSRDQKIIALEHIGNALKRGSTNEELRISLDYLSLEGTQNQVRQGRRLMNDYPDIRRQAVKYLGDVRTKEAKTTLIKVCTTDNELMVLQEAVKSLGTIGINENDDAVNAIVWVTTKNFNTDAPDSILAIAALDALEKFAKKDNRLDPNAVQLIMKISEGPYFVPVKEMARQTLQNVSKYALKNNR